MLGHILELRPDVLVGNGMNCHRGALFFSLKTDWDVRKKMCINELQNRIGVYSVTEKTKTVKEFVVGKVNLVNLVVIMNK